MPSIEDLFLAKERARHPARRAVMGTLESVNQKLQDSYLDELAGKQKKKEELDQLAQEQRIKAEASMKESLAKQYLKQSEDYDFITDVKQELKTGSEAHDTWRPSIRKVSQQEIQENIWKDTKESRKFLSEGIRAVPKDKDQRQKVQKERAVPASIIGIASMVKGSVKKDQHGLFVMRSQGKDKASIRKDLTSKEDIYNHLAEVGLDIPILRAAGYGSLANELEKTINEWESIRLEKEKLMKAGIAVDKKRQEEQRRRLLAEEEKAKGKIAKFFERIGERIFEKVHKQSLPGLE